MRGQTVSVECYRCHMTLNLPDALTDITKENLRKIFLLIFQEAWRNEEAIKTIDIQLQEISEELKRKWCTASLAYQREYKDPDYQYYTENGISKKYTKKELRSFRAKNKRMMQAVISAKRNYEVFLTRIEMWEEIKRRKL